MLISRYKLFRFAEYASVSASVLGAIIAISTRQLVYVFTPLSITLVLNLANRRQQEQHIEQHLTQTITQVNQRLDRVSKQSKLLQQSLNALTQAAGEQAADAEAIIHVNTVELRALESDITQRIETLFGNIQTIRNRLEQQNQQMSTFASLSSLEELATNLGQFQMSLDNISIQIGTDLEHRLQNLAQTQQEIFDAQQTTSKLSLTSLESDVAQLRSDLTQLEQLGVSQSIHTLAGEIQALQNRLEQQSQRMSRFTDLYRFEELAAALSQVQISLDNISAQAESNLERRLQGLAQVQQQIFNEQHSALRQYVASLENDVLQLGSKSAYLQQELEDLIAQFREQSYKPDLSSPSEDEPISDFSHIAPQLPTDQNYDLEINLGLDFGTGFTKVCFRDIGQERSEIVTFSESEAIQNDLSLDKTLIPAKIAILQDGTLLTGLTISEWQASDSSIRQSLDFIKMRLAHLDLPNEAGWRLEQIPELDDPATVESLCAYYLSQVIKRAQRWIRTNRSELFINQTVRWSVNVGVPVEYCDSPALERFRDVLSLAWLLNYTQLETSTLTLPVLNQLIAHLQRWRSKNHIGDLDCKTTPEIAAAVWSFLSSREAQDGFYTFFDIGDGTLDGAAFRFWREGEGDLHVDFYKGKVEPLGVSAFTQQAAAELNNSSENIRQALTHNSDHDLHDKIYQSKAHRDVQKLVASVVIDGKDKHHNSRQILAKDDIGRQLKVFVGGGGGNTLFFKNTIQATHSDFGHGSAGIPPYQIRQIPPPKDLSINGLDPKEFNRFAVAYGLCIPDWEGPEIRLPSQIETNKLPSNPVKFRSNKYEDTKDMM